MGILGGGSSRRLETTTWIRIDCREQAFTYFSAERFQVYDFPIILCCGEEAASMRRKSSKSRRAVLRFRDLDHSKAAVLNSLGSPASRRAYQFAMDSFIEWYCSEPRLAFGRVVVTRFRMSLEARGLSSSIRGLRPCVGSPMRPPIAACSAPNSQPESAGSRASSNSAIGPATG